MQQDILQEITMRGLVCQSTDMEALRLHLREPRAIYCGYDPTGPSLQVGNLVPLLVQARLQRAGHIPVVVLGGATGQIGDPSGKSSDRPLLDLAVIRENKERQRAIFEHLLTCSDAQMQQAIIVDNLDWLSDMRLIGALRDFGRHFSVNEMIRRDAVKERMKRQQGLSLTEFLYGVFQAIDFQHLHSAYGVTVEIGGSDQWSNILSGVDLVRRTANAVVYGFTCPLVTKDDGTKFGKTESGPVWLSADLTSVYGFYQFFLNVSDSESGRLLRLLTLLPLREINEIEQHHIADPGARLAQKVLARWLTTFVHGMEEMQKVEGAAMALFNGNFNDIPADLIDETLASVPRTLLPRSGLANEPMAVVDLLCQTALCESKREARELLSAGAVSVNGTASRSNDKVSTDRLLYGKYAVVRKGRRTWHLAVWE